MCSLPQAERSLPGSGFDASDFVLWPNRDLIAAKILAARFVGGEWRNVQILDLLGIEPFERPPISTSDSARTRGALTIPGSECDAIRYLPRRPCPTR
jgi:hypothetical protein